ncbi:IS110 family transposase [Belnapia sp. T6]|uniref:IS110 family transposase n=1 Tax=Belnapia mucosa TaxID=2804532 RepID=A0ABS1VGE9_9PROT|nr:transposase [Belnapia mucosa]MBL6459503.1 IS110 family transposase [Belnapia mucosa]
MAQIEALEGRIERLDSRMVRHAREDETARRLASIPGIGAIGATALAAMMSSPHGYASGRHFAASLVLTPKLHSSGGKERPGRISR